MNKDKLLRLVKYSEDIKSKLTSQIPEKHKNRSECYKAFLERELRVVTNIINSLKMSTSDSK